MKIEILVPLFTLLGALVGAFFSIAISWISEHYRNEREKEKLIYELGKIYWQAPNESEEAIVIKSSEL